MADRPRHRAHANYCDICDKPIPNGKRRKMEIKMCLSCIKSPPESMLCGHPTVSGKPCRALARFEGRCHNHKESQSTSS